MKVKLLALMVLTVTAVPIVIAQDTPGVPDPSVPDPGDPGDPGDAVPDPEDVGDQGADEEAFPAIQEFPCPVPDWESTQISGETTWQESTHPRAEGCVASWGDGAYTRGSQAVLGTPGLPTGHLATTQLHQTTLNDATQALIETGLDPQMVGATVGALASGCGNPLKSHDWVFDICEAAFSSGGQAVHVPESAAGGGALYFEIEHAYQFSEADENYRAPDGGWLEVKKPGQAWERLRPVGLFNPASDGVGTLCAATGPAAVAAGDQVPTGVSTDPAFIPNVILPGDTDLQPSTTQEWRESCAGLVSGVYNEDPTQGFGDLNPEQFGIDVADSDAVTGVSDQFTPYPGVIRGEGPGFVGSTTDENDRLVFVEHWFDLAPYAGETVQVRFNATAGEGIGAREGGWWVDEANVRYGGPPHDLSVRLDVPEEGASFPPGKAVPVTAEVQNLGRTTSQPAQVEISLGQITTTRPVGELDPLESVQVTANLPTATAGEYNATATLGPANGAGDVDTPSQAPEASSGYSDMNPDNDQAVSRLVVEHLTDLSLNVEAGNVTDAGVANVTLTVESDGNQLEFVPVDLRVENVDRVTRQPRTDGAVELGTVATLPVPPSEEANSLGLPDASNSTSVTVNLPGKGIWRLNATTPLDADAGGAVVVSHGESAPLAFTTKLSNVNEGPTPETINEGFEIGDVIATGQDLEETPSFQANLLHPVDGPETRFLPDNETALAAYGNEAPRDYSPVATTALPEEACPEDVIATCESVDALAEVEVGFPSEIRTPASAQAWNLREHHVSVYGVGTTDDTEDAFQELAPGDDGRVKLQMRHAANVDFSDGTGKQARVIAVPASTLDVAGTLADLNTSVREATEPLPPEQEAVAQRVMDQVFLDQLLNSVAALADQSQVSRFPQDICSSPQLEPVRGLLSFCGNPGVFGSLESSCGQLVSCEFPEPLATTIHENAAQDDDTTPGQLSGESKVVEIDEPTGWTNLTMDVTDIAKAGHPEADEDGEGGDRVGYYVIFDLVTSTDFEEVVATARAGQDAEGSSYTVETGRSVDEDVQESTEGADTRVGTESFDAPDWTIDEPELVRYEDGARQLGWDLCDDPGTCSEEQTLPMTTNRGWEHLQQGKESSWRYEALGGDPTGLEPGAFVWGGGSQPLHAEGGDPSNREDGLLSTYLGPEAPEPYSVLSTPMIDLSGYEKPIADVTAEFSKVDVREGATEAEVRTPTKCEEASNDPSGTVWTRTGWNVRARPVLEDGSLGEATTVHPVTGYHDCSDAGEVPIRFNASAYMKDAPTVFQKQTSAEETSPTEGGAVAYRQECFARQEVIPNDVNPVPQRYPDTFQQCRPVELQFGHGQPVFGLDMDWQSVRFDLSEFDGQRVKLEIHAIGTNPSSGTANPRGELRIDDITVKESTPVADLRLEHPPRSTIAPDTSEGFELNITNNGATPTEEVTLRRTVIGPDGCQAVEPTTVTSTLVDPETGKLGLPSGANATLEDPRLKWDVPDELREAYERQIHVSPLPTVPPSRAPEISIGHSIGTDEVELTVLDRDDCLEEVEVETEVLAGDPENVDEPSDATEPVLVDRSDDDEDFSFDETAPVVRAEAVDPHGVESTPAYVAPPPNLEEDPSDDASREAVATLLQSARSEAADSGSLVEISLEASKDIGVSQVVIPSEDGSIRRLNAHTDPVQLRGLAPGSYFGYILVDGQSYEPVSFEIPVEPPTGADADVSDNTVSLRSEIREEPGLEITEVIPPLNPSTEDPFDVEVVLENTGNIPLFNVTTDITVDPFGIDRTEPTIPRMAPGQRETITVEDLEIKTPGSQQLEVHAQNTPRDGGEVVEASTGGSFAVFEITEVAPVRQTDDVWDLGGESFRFGDGNRVPPDTNAPLSLEGAMDLARSPLSALVLNHSGNLERSYDGIAVEWNADDGTTSLQRQASASDGSDEPTALEELTSSRAGAEPGETTPALTGDLNPQVLGTGNLTTLASSGIQGATAEPVGEINASEWTSPGSFRLDVDESALDGGDAFWLPTASLVEGPSGVEHELRVPLTKSDWCDIRDEYKQTRQTVQITVDERRLFSDDVGESRGWDASVRLETGTVTDFDTSERISGPRLEATPIVALEDEHATGWEKVTYEIDPSDLLRFYDQNAVPFTTFQGASRTYEDPCEAIREEPDQGGLDVASNAELVFELRSESSGEGGSLDVGWFIGSIDVDPLGKTVGPSSGNHKVAPCWGEASSLPDHVSPPAVRGCTRLDAGQDTKRGSLAGVPEADEDANIVPVSTSTKRVQVINLGGSPVSNDADDDVTTLSELLEPRPMEHDGDVAGAPLKNAFGLESPSRFTYVDAVALADLRPSRQGQIDIEVNVTGTGSATPLMQIVGAPIQPDEADGEDAASRVDWQPLEVCEDRDDLEPESVTMPHTPLGADASSIVGTPLEPDDADEDALYVMDIEGMAAQGDTIPTVCAEVDPISGRLSWIGVRAWLPSEGTTLALGDAEITMRTPDPQRLSPTLRGLTDGTVQKGTWELYDAKLLSMAPPFSHAVSTEILGTQPWSPDEETTRDVLPSRSEPSAAIHVRQPASPAEWTLTKANLTVGLSDGGDIESDLHDLEDDRVGPQTIELDWDDLRAAFEDMDVANGSWFAKEPVLPRNVTSLELSVKTQPDALVNQVRDCPTDFDDLNQSRDLECRQLADLVDAVNEDATTVATEQQLPDVGIRQLDILPERGAPGTPRTAHLQLTNPQSVPVELNGTLKVLPVDGETPQAAVPWGPVQLEPWETENVTVDLKLPDQPGSVDRWIVEADTLGDLDAVEDYRATRSHPTWDLLEPFFFDDGGVGIEETPEAAQPVLEGQFDDGLGWHMEGRGSNSITALRTNSIPVTEADEGGGQDGSLEEILQDGEAPLFVFQHQRDLYRDVAGGGQDTDFAFMAVTAQIVGGDDDNPAPWTEVLEGWAPDKSEVIGTHENAQDEEQCVVNDVADEGITTSDEIFTSSTSSGTVEADRASKWSTAALEIPMEELRELSASARAMQNSGDAVFSIILGTCQPSGESEMLVDNVAITSGRPLAEVGADDIPIQPGAQKDYRVTLNNEGAGSSVSNVVPANVPSGWTIRVTSQDEVLYDSVTGQVSSVRLEEGETRPATLSVKVPSGTRDSLERVLPLRLYETHAPGVRSSAGLNSAVEEISEAGEQADDPGHLKMKTARKPLPDLGVEADTFSVEDAEIGRDATVQFEVLNRGEAMVEDIQIRATARGPSGSAELTPIKDDNPEPGVRATLEPNTPKQFTFTWRPSEAGTHTIRAMVDAPQDDLDVVFGDDDRRFLGQVQEATECVPDDECPNLVDHKVHVRELQKPDLAVDVNPLPDRIPAGEEVPLEVTVENNGGVTARDIELTLTENGLLPVFDTPTRTLDPIEPGNATTLRTEWSPVTPGDILLLGSVTASDDFVGTRSDGSSATDDNTVAQPITIDRARTSVELLDELATKPGRSDTAEARIVNDGTGPLTVDTRTEQQGDVLLGPVLDAPVTIEPGESQTVELVASAPLATAPQTVRLDVPLSQGQASVPVTVLKAADANVFLEDEPLQPGETEVDARVTNRGNVPLDGTLHVRGRGISGSTTVDVGLGETQNVTVPVQVDPATSPGDHQIATRIDLGTDGAVTSDHRVSVDEAMAFDMRLIPDRTPLSGSTEGRMVLRNVGNQPFKGRLAVDGPVSVDDPAIELTPGQSAPRKVTWLSGAEMNGTLELVDLDGETVATRTLDPAEVSANLEVSNVETRPGVNLEEGMTVQVVATVQNAGPAAAGNRTLGITIDGTLYQTSTTPELAPGEATVVSEEIELPRSGSLTVGAVELSALQRGETAGAVTTVEVADGGLGLGTIAEVPTVPLPGLLLALGAVAVVRRR